MTYQSINPFTEFVLGSFPEHTNAAAVAAEAGKTLKKSTMELSGSDAFIVLDDANLNETVRLAVQG